MTLDDVLDHLGKFGRYQVLTYFLCCLASQLPSYWQLFAIVFIGYINPHRCTLPANTTAEKGIPIVVGPDGRPGPSSCTMYKNVSINSSIVGCTDGYQYDTDGFNPHQGTITMEWDLVCDKDAYVELSQTIFNIGVVVGFFLFTPFADRYGRRKVFFVCEILMAAFGIGMAFAPNFISFCVFQFLTGGFASGLYVSGMVLACELFPTSIRSTMAPLTPLFATFAMTTLPVWAYFLRSWRHLQFGISMAGALSLFYYWFCPESFRWLLANGRVSECKQILQTVAKFNRKSLPEELLKHEDENARKAAPKDGGASFLLYLKTPRTRVYLIILCYMKLVNSVMFFGLAYMMGALDGNLYSNFFLSAAIDVPAIVTAVLVMPRIGRRIPLTFFHIFSGVFMALSAVASIITVEGFDNGKLVLACALIARVGVGGAFAVEIIYGQELFPTNLRSTGVGISEGTGYIGAILSPFTVYLFRLVPWLPGTVFGVLSIVGGLCVYRLPETVGRRLPQTVEEVANWPLTLTAQEKVTYRNNRIFGAKKKSVGKDTRNVIHSTRL